MEFPKELQGERIVARECLVDGSVDGSSLSELYETRWNFLNDTYGDFSRETYFSKTVSEFEKTQNIPAGSEVNLWFEDDLFCQVNFWFIAHLLAKNHQDLILFLVRPNINTPYSFGSMNEQELIVAFQKKIKLEASEIKDLANLWTLYQKSDYVEMLEISEKLREKFPFLKPVIIASKEQLHSNGIPGRPTLSLLRIMKELNTDNFGEIFRAFCNQEAIYGFGDLQVKRLLNEIQQI